MGSSPALRGLDGRTYGVEFKILVAGCVGGCKIIGLLNSRFPRSSKPLRSNSPIFVGYIRFLRPRGKLVRSSGFYMYSINMEEV